ncbi:MAG: hypothetical protein QOG20_1833 [Pseudonocardiales bacterium]|jgi:hypothetical protein|nr:hypothetical protein [Pseudonocardiales bacterium]
MNDTGAVKGTTATGVRVVVRPRKAVIASWIGSVVIVVLFVVIALVLRNTATGVFFRFADQVALVLMGLFIAGGVLLLARPRVVADAEGLEVRNFLLSRYYSWEVVEHIAFPDGASWARLDLPDDEYMPVLAIQAVDGTRAVDGIRRVRALHAAARSAGSTGTT